ncbi:receptor-like protein 35 [Cornus florida]|uniref:receptor-like protein 35 n=1 Tax=Cornus florida TaxID=4283 RepID=UPI002898F303|nr:receptor-like protein 35 [Cornus florida]
MSTSSKLDRDSDPNKVDHFLYRSMIGSLLYLEATRPDISFSIGVCARYQADPREQHILAVKRIIRYVNSTLNYGLRYSSKSNSEIAGYTDVDWAGNKDDRKSNSGGCFYVGTNLVSCNQRVTALNLFDMGLSGTIALHLGNLSFLTSLDISYKGFNGHIPKELASLDRLLEIDLQYNNFSGEVPSWFGILSKLQHLFLFNNSFTGTIPPSIFNISKLEMLNINYNSLHGNISQETGNLSNLKVLDLNFNKLTGSIPSAIFNMSSLQVIDLTSNNLSDSLPIDMCTQISLL